MTNSDSPVVAPDDERTFYYKPNKYTPTESAGFLMRRVLSSILQQADAQLEVHGLTYVQWLPLYKLLLCADTTNAQLAKDLGMDPASVTRALDRIEAKGLLRRERSTADRRVVHLVLTDEGRRIAADVPQVLSRVLNCHLAGFSHEECRTLVAMLQRMIVNGDAMRSSPSDDTILKPDADCLVPSAMNPR
ncbi:MarR family winged helix-turn-helix transcriptional regulator [Diaphorobacter caeni]|uniref:MarR family winged helix-turn-helix transcriptional regulator n=1 Tax=Diaphorobacter caeni TaxID=2784387 RepID=UPI00188F2621|nr:MarR family winged helix-turn-helix transcriptional regulator [Diaphorobacter caeni]MBF5004689.1 winged helix-turn-helix transcriptional regulator [Diaphorobacter caeni]